MPNTPLMVFEGASILFPNPHCTSSDYQRIAAIFGCAGIVERALNEGQIDAVTALSGSGPAYIFRMMEALTQGGIELGLSEEVAERLAIQTVLGAGKLAKQMRKDEGQRPVQLRKMVTSEKGTTEAAIQHLDQHHFFQIVLGAVHAAFIRCQQLSANL